MPHKNDVENIFPHVHGWKSQNGWKVWMKIEHQWTFWMIITSSQIVLDERFNKLKCMDEINSKIVMWDENHMYMDESYKIWMKY
jgi:hypothetical protein